MKKRAVHQYVRVGTPDNFKPFRDAYVPTVGVVACPACGADVGQRCMNSEGDPVSVSHRPRRRAAVRLRNAQEPETPLPAATEVTTPKPQHFIELPPVLYANGQPVTSRLDPERKHDRRARKPNGSGVRLYGECETCDTIVSGERRFCGVCLAKRMARRGRDS